VGFYATLVLIVLLGVASVGFSRYQVQHPPKPTPPTVHDHWHEAYAIDICGKIQPNLPQNPNLQVAGIHTHGKGVIHVEPFSVANPGPFEGHNATLGRFVRSYPGLTLTSSELGYPKKRTWHNGDRCGTKPGRVQVKVWNSLADTTGHTVANPDKLLLENGQLITVAFVPAGAPIPRPPHAAVKALLAAMGSTGNGPGTSTPSTTPAGPPTTHPGGGPPTQGTTKP
jgi:hypothetical protein